MIPQFIVLSSAMLAVLASAGAMSTRLDVKTRLVLAAVGMVWWALYAFGTYNVAVPAGDGSFETFRLTSHMMVGAVSALIMLLFAIDKVQELL